MERNEFTKYFPSLLDNKFFSLHYMSHHALLHSSRKITKISVKHNSASGTVHCYMFRFLRNHHQAFHVKHLNMSITEG